MKGRLNHKIILNEQHNLTCSFKKNDSIIQEFHWMSQIDFFVCVFWNFLFAESHIVILHCRRMEVNQN